MLCDDMRYPWLNYVYEGEILLCGEFTPLVLWQN